jgi:hypothetical protein
VEQLEGRRVWSSCESEVANGVGQLEACGGVCKSQEQLDGRLGRVEQLRVRGGERRGALRIRGGERQGAAGGTRRRLRIVREARVTMA